LQPIRVAVGEMPRLLREIIVKSLSPHANLEIIELELPAAESSDLPLDVGIDVLMLSSDGAELTAEHERFLWSRPRLRLFAIDSGGRRAALYELQPHRITLTEISTEDLADAIHNACSGKGTAGLVETTVEH